MKNAQPHVGHFHLAIQEETTSSANAVPIKSGREARTSPSPTRRTHRSASRILARYNRLTAEASVSLEYRFVFSVTVEHLAASQLPRNTGARRAAAAASPSAMSALP